MKFITMIKLGLCTAGPGRHSMFEIVKLIFTGLHFTVPIQLRCTTLESQMVYPLFYNGDFNEAHYLYCQK